MWTRPSQPKRTLPFAAAAVLLALSGAARAPASDDQQTGQRVDPPTVEVVTPFVFRGDLRDLPTVPAWRPGDPIKEIPRRYTPPPGGGPMPGSTRPDDQGPDPLLALQEAVPRISGGRLFDTLTVDIDGQGFSGVNPPDTVGDVGADYYIQMINGASGAIFTVYDKSDGSVAAGPTALESLGSGPCSMGLGDPIVLYDQLAGRWLLSEFSSAANRLCVYVSQTSDPISGGWYVYDFTATDFPDYPKYAVWPDGYYVTTNEGSPAAYALERTAMLSGGMAGSQRFVASDLSGFGFEALTPSDVDGPTAPPAGAPNYMIRHRDTEVHGSATCTNGETTDCLELWQFSVDWATPENSTFTLVETIEITEIDSDLCGLSSFECFAQPGTGTTLDPLREVVMWRHVYRNLGTHQTLLGSLVTDVDGTDRGGVRWFELRKSGAGPWTLFQEGTYSPDGDNRWMSSIAMDAEGNIALGHNVSSSSTHPSLRYAGRRVGDPAGTLPLGEHTLVAGSAANGSNRYGDYSSLNLDPVDDCTFWFTGEYNINNDTSWSTRIGSFDICSETPEATILSPADGSTFNKETLISFTGTATDLQDGDLTAGIGWTSDLDGSLGTGGAVLSTLTEGAHTITAEVTDVDMNSGSDTIQVVVTADGCSDHVVLANDTLTAAASERARFSITLGPSYTVSAGGALTARSETVILAEGTTVVGELLVELSAGSCDP